jgi:hypothetical protein
MIRELPPSFKALVQTVERLAIEDDIIQSIASKQIIPPFPVAHPTDG